MLNTENVRHHCMILEYCHIFTDQSNAFKMKDEVIFVIFALNFCFWPLSGIWNGYFFTGYYFFKWDLVSVIISDFTFLCFPKTVNILSYLANFNFTFINQYSIFIFDRKFISRNIFILNTSRTYEFACVIVEMWYLCDCYEKKS